MPNHSAHRPSLVFSVGITGTRNIPVNCSDDIRQHLVALLRFVRQEVTCLSRMAEARSVYQLETDQTIAPWLRFVSPLAEGADRLVAEVALEQGYSLYVPMPFVREEYEKDFGPQAGEGSSRAAFSRLVNQAAATLELDGGRGDDQDSSYEAVGRHVVRNADLLIAVWDGHPAKGRGGSGDIVRFAIRAGVPVWWIPVDCVSPDCLLRTTHELRDPSVAPANEAAMKALAALIHRALLPPKAPPPHAHGRLGRIVHAFAHMWGHKREPLSDYLAESGDPPSMSWPLYGRFMDLVAGRAIGGSLMLPAEGSIERYWHGFYEPADTLSNAYRNRYRSSYLLIFLFAFAAVVCAVATPFGRSLAKVATAIEIVPLLAIAVIVVSNHLMRWHERWISYRLLSELCRKQQVLAPLGWSLPNWEIERLSATGDIDPHGGQPRDAWVAWYFTAVRRAAPIPEGVVAKLELARARDVGRSFLNEQIDYHDSRHARAVSAAHKLGTWGETCFALTIVSIVIKLWLLWHSDTQHKVASSLLDAVSTLLPAASVTFFGIRAYSEFELLAHQSYCMRHSINTALSELNALSLDRPLTSQAIGAQLYGVAIAMLQDIAGWAQLFRVKMVETT
jgi:hypothetical protein